MIEAYTIDYFVTEKYTCILVDGTDGEQGATIIVRVALDARTILQLKVGMSIWWEGSKVMLDIGDRVNMKFTKISKPYGNAQQFYIERENEKVIRQQLNNN